MTLWVAILSLSAASSRSVLKAFRYSSNSVKLVTHSLFKFVRNVNASKVE